MRSFHRRVHPYRTLALDVPNELRHCVFWWYWGQYMHMVRRQLPSLNLAFTLLDQTVKNLTQMMAKGL
jgi:hypothetical protein